MIKQAQFEIIRVPYTNDPIDIQAIVLIIDKAIHVLINDSSILKDTKTIQVSRAISEMLNNTVHGQSHEYYINIAIADSQRQLIDTFLRMLNTFNTPVLVTWAAQWTYDVFDKLDIEGLEYIYKPELSDTRYLSGINSAFRFGIDKKLYVSDGNYKCITRVPKQPNYTAYAMITELLGKEYYKELETYSNLTGLAYAVKAITCSPCEYIATEVFNTLSICLLLDVVEKIT